MTGTTLQKIAYLKATPLQVWAYLTDPEKLAIWFHKPKTPLIEGEYAMYGTESVDRLMWGDVLVAEPFRRLEYTFAIAPLGDKTSTPKWAHEKVADGTHLSLVREGLQKGTEAFGLTLASDKGWDDRIARMRAALHAA
jgi:uncharacterized protein YndB with AHSA1/START domain